MPVFSFFNRADVTVSSALKPLSDARHAYRRLVLKHHRPLGRTLIKTILRLIVPSAFTPFRRAVASYMSITPQNTTSPQPQPLAFSCGSISSALVSASFMTFASYNGRFFYRRSFRPFRLLSMDAIGPLHLVARRRPLPKSLPATCCRGRPADAAVVPVEDAE